LLSIKQSKPSCFFLILFVNIFQAFRVSVQPESTPKPTKAETSNAFCGESKNRGSAALPKRQIRRQTQFSYFFVKQKSKLNRKKYYSHTYMLFLNFFYHFFEKKVDFFQKSGF